MLVKDGQGQYYFAVGKPGVELPLRERPPPQRLRGKGVPIVPGPDFVYKDAGEFFSADATSHTNYYWDCGLRGEVRVLEFFWLCQIKPTLCAVWCEGTTPSDSIFC